MSGKDRKRKAKPKAVERRTKPIDAGLRPSAATSTSSSEREPEEITTVPVSNGSALDGVGDKVSVTRIAGSRKTCRRCLLSPDCRKVITLVDSQTIQVFGVPDGKLLHSIDLQDHEPDGKDSGATWCSLVLWPHDPNRLLCAVSRDGWILLLNYASVSAGSSRYCARWKFIQSGSRNKEKNANVAEPAQQLAGLYFQQINKPSNNQQTSCPAFGLVRSFVRNDQPSALQTPGSQNVPANSCGSRTVSFSVYSLSMDASAAVGTKTALAEALEVRAQNGLIHQLGPEMDRVVFHPLGEFIAAISGTELKVFFLPSTLFKKHRVQDERSFTCLACHPTELCVATGDVQGRIILWHGLDNTATVTRSVLKWHASAVADLVFSSQGAFLWSGGAESTLVQWSLADTAHKDFLPRMVAPIDSLTFAGGSGASVLAVQHRNNTITLVGAQRNILGRIDDFFSTSQTGDSIPFVHYDPNSEKVVLPGQPGQLAFYDLSEKKLTFTVDVAGQNAIWSAAEGWEAANPKVDALGFLRAVGASPARMFTAESLTTKHIGTSVQLKFWIYNSQLNKYTVENVVLDPHDGQIISHIAVDSQSQGDDARIVTLASNGFKLWTLIKGPSPQWICMGEGVLGDLPVLDGVVDRTCAAAAFSSSRNILAVSFGSLITLWSVVPVLSRRNILVEGQNHQPVVSGGLRFVGKDESLLAAVTASELTFWDIRSGHVLKKLSLSSVNYVEQSGRWLILGGNGTLSVVDAERISTLIEKHKDSIRTYSISGDSERKIVSCGCIPRRTSETKEDIRWEEDFRVISLTSTGELWSMGLPLETRNQVLAEPLANDYGEWLKNLSVQKNPAAVGQESLQQDSGKKPGFNIVQQILSAPAYQAPPVPWLVNQVLSSLIHENNPSRDVEMPAEDIPAEVSREKDDSDMEESVALKERPENILMETDAEVAGAEMEDALDWSFLRSALQLAV